MLEGMLIAWGIVNFIGFICFCVAGLNTGGWFDVFVYPSVGRRLFWANIRGAKAIVIEVLLTIIFLPLAVAYFTFVFVASVIVLLLLLVFGAVEAIKHRNDVYDDEAEDTWDV